MSLTEDTGLSLGTAICGFAVGAVDSVLVARLLGPAGRGELGLITVASSMLVRVASLGIGAAVVYHIGARRHEVGGVVGNAALASLGLGVASALGFWTIYPLLGSTVLAGARPGLLLLSVATVPILLITMVLGQALVALRRVAWYGLVTIASVLTLLVLDVALVLGLRLHTSGAVAASALAAAVGCALSWLLARRVSAMSLSPDPVVIKELLGFGLRGYLGNVTMFLAYRLDVLLVNLFLGTAAVGYYLISVFIAERVLLLANSVALVLLPRTSALSAEESNRLVPVVTRNVIFLAAIGCGVLVLAGKRLLLLVYGDAFSPAVAPMLLLLPGIVLLSGDKILSSYITGRGRPLLCSMAATSALVTNIGLNLVLIPRCGIAGASVASTISYAVSFGVVLAVFGRMSGRGAGETTIVRVQDAALYVQASLRFARRFGLLRGGSDWGP